MKALRLFAVFALLTQCLFASGTSQAKTFKPFTGKVLGNKVRLRAAPDLQGIIIRELDQNDLVLIVDEIGDYYAIQAPNNLSAYIYRSYIYDGKIDANRVNLRLGPSTQAPIIGTMSMGEAVSIKNTDPQSKWIEIAAPEKVQLYISKEFISHAGSANYLKEMEKRKDKVQIVLEDALHLAAEEKEKPFEKMQPQEAITKLQSIIEKYSDLSEEVRQAKTQLVALQENYLEKKLAYLASVNNKEQEIEEIFFPEVEKNPPPSASASLDTWKRENPYLPPELTPKMKAWVAIEKDLFDSWASFNPEKRIEDFYQEQKANAQVVSGVLQSYDPNVHNRPGDYVLRKNGAFVAFLYSTHLNLDAYLGKKVSLYVAPRPNNHFAFPAYFVLQVE